VNVKTDQIDSKLLARLRRMSWLPTSYVPSRELRWLKSLLRHRAFSKKMSTAVKGWTPQNRHRCVETVKSFYFTISALAALRLILVILIFTWSLGFALATNIPKPWILAMPSP